MNYFEFYVGDYARDTAHLSLAEHGAFLMLLAAYYGTEKPLAPDLASLHRIARAMSQAEQKAVKSVADQFFPIAADGFRHNARADEIIARAQVRIDNARANGAKGGRPQKGENEGKTPPKSPSQDGLSTPAARNASGGRISNEINTSENPAGFVPLTQQLTHSGEALQAPCSKEQEHSCASADADAPPTRSDAIPYQAIADAYNATLTGLPKVREVTGKRRTAIRREWLVSTQRRSLGFWLAYFAECHDDAFLNGTGPYREPHANWRPDFDYLLRAEVVTRTFERAMDRLERDA